MERKIRYMDKLAHIDRRMANIESWLPSQDEERTRLAIYKAFQEIVEAFFDMLSMKLVELKIPPKDDYTNILLIEEKGLIDKDTSSILRSANGLRNRLVHNYNEISDKLALESIKTLLPKLAKIRKDLESWTST
ncbi:MAG: DUF86 domain-containing protein [Candidatus Brockarchaeota archaeon]|nr:DUF86 domain-containing protein [Candidatus Brockarchaeota archaeon]MBO3840915.1 DUF86 domain-containing protein [Candidatus Brockarchaeota archaeon]